MIEPRNEVERAVAEIWKELLGLDRVGVDDDFFELGGHSLLATQVLARIAAKLGVELPLQRVFERPTVAGLAELVQMGRWRAAERNGGEDEEREELEL